MSIGDQYLLGTVGVIILVDFGVGTSELGPRRADRLPDRGY